MPELPFPDPVRELLLKPNPSVIATVRRSGQPVTVPTWYRMDGDQVVVNMDADRKRLEHMRRDPRVSISVLDADDWYTHVTIIGRVARIEDDADLTGIDVISRHYSGDDYPVRNKPRVQAWIAVDRWMAWGRLRQWSKTTQ